VGTERSQLLSHVLDAVVNCLGVDEGTTQGGDRLVGLSVGFLLLRPVNKIAGLAVAIANLSVDVLSLLKTLDLLQE